MVTKLVVDAGRLWTNLDWSTGQPKFRTDHITKSGAAKAAKMSGTTMDSDAGFRRLVISDQARESKHLAQELHFRCTVPASCRHVWELFCNWSELLRNFTTWSMSR